MLGMDEFVDACIAANREADPTAAIADLMRAFIADPEAVEAGVKARGVPMGNASILYRAPDLTILDIRQVPGFSGTPHDHLMWVVSGVYRGQEDTTLYRLDGDQIEPTGAAFQLVAPAVCVLRAEDLHDVSNPLTVECANLQVCGGDFIAARPNRRRWDLKTGEATYRS
jgi:predicted metal-dependent enzyme (double-stranded beta helix superfamily)